MSSLSRWWKKRLKDKEIEKYHSHGCNGSIDVSNVTVNGSSPLQLVIMGEDAWVKHFLYSHFLQCGTSPREQEGLKRDSYEVQSISKNQRNFDLLCGSFRVELFDYCFSSEKLSALEDLNILRGDIFVFSFSTSNREGFRKLFQLYDRISLVKEDVPPIILVGVQGKRRKRSEGDSQNSSKTSDTFLADLSDSSNEANMRDILARGDITPEEGEQLGQLLENPFIFVKTEDDVHKFQTCLEQVITKYAEKKMNEQKEKRNHWWSQVRDLVKNKPSKQ